MNYFLKIFIILIALLPTIAKSESLIPKFNLYLKCDNKIESMIWMVNDYGAFKWIEKDGVFSGFMSCDDKTYGRNGTVQGYRNKCEIYPTRIEMVMRYIAEGFDEKGGCCNKNQLRGRLKIDRLDGSFQYQEWGSDGIVTEDVAGKCIPTKQPEPKAAKF